MDDLVRYGPWVLSLVALLLAWSASLAASRARASADAHERAFVAAPPETPATPAADACAPARPTGFEERLGALEVRIATLADRVAFVARPDPDDVTPMRPPVPSTVEPVTAPRAGWRMFP